MAVENEKKAGLIVLRKPGGHSLPSLGKNNTSVLGLLTAGTSPVFVHFLYCYTNNSYTGIKRRD